MQRAYGYLEAIVGPPFAQRILIYDASMDIEQLSKSQIVLLTLLVSFVTSIATGIVTVSLMEKAPPLIAQTVNRIVEHTVQTVVPAASGQAAATVVTQEKTIVVHESEQISKAVEKIAPSLVRLYAREAGDAPFLPPSPLARRGGRACGRVFFSCFLKLCWVS